MDFLNIAKTRQSCRAYDGGRAVEPEKLSAILEAARLAPSACNGQPYHITVCTGDAATACAKATQGMGMNKFASDAPVLLVISEEPYVASAALGVSQYQPKSNAPKGRKSALFFENSLAKSALCFTHFQKISSNFRIFR